MGTRNIMDFGVQNVIISNWAKTYSCAPKFYFEPRTTDELKDIVTLAQEKESKIRVYGCGHSPSDLAFSNEIVVSLKNMDKVLQIDLATCRVKVQGGITLSKLCNSELVRYGLALSVLGSTSELTLAGAISTATHGSGIKFGNLSTFVLELEILTSEGDVIECSRDKNLDIFLAVCCGLGAFGIIQAITIQCEPAFNLEEYRYAARLKDIIENLPVHLRSSDHFRFIWFPHTDNTVVWHMRRTKEKPSVTGLLHKLGIWVLDYAIGYYFLEFCFWLSSFKPQIVPIINNVFYAILYTTPRHRIDRSDKVFNFECLFKQHVMEWAIDADKAALALNDLQVWLGQNPNEFLHFPVEVRFVKNDDLFISPCYGRDSCYINLVMYRPYGKVVEFEAIWDAFGQIMIKLGGRPHWAKAHKVSPKQFFDIYPKFKKWCEIRSRLDPKRMFVNAYIERILPPSF